MTRSAWQRNLDNLSPPFIAFLRALPDWHRDAHCINHPAIDWAPAEGEPTEPAKAICRRCPIRPQCLTWALSHDEHGVWAATTDAERRTMRRRNLA